MGRCGAAGDGEQRAGARLCFAFKKRLPCFGAATAPAKGKKAKKSKGTLSPRKQWDRFKSLVSHGSPQLKVYAKSPDAEWTEVAVAAPGTAAQAAQ